MSVIVTDSGFAPDSQPFRPGDATMLHLPADTDAEALAALRPRLAPIRLIRVEFPSFSDGRGFTIARQLRLMGYDGRLRAHGPVLADQYAMARRAGFDEVEISDDLAARQTEAPWRARANWQNYDYQSRLRG